MGKIEFIDMTVPMEERQERAKEGVREVYAILPKERPENWATILNDADFSTFLSRGAAELVCARMARMEAMTKELGTPIIVTIDENHELWKRALEVAR